MSVVRLPSLLGVLPPRHGAEDAGHDRCKSPSKRCIVWDVPPEADDGAISVRCRKQDSLFGR
jgi:hypothetical protein